MSTDQFGAKICKTTQDCPQVAGYICASTMSWPQRGCGEGEDGCLCEVRFPPEPGGIAIDGGMPMVPDAGPTAPQHYPDTWMNDPVFENMGQFGFRSLHPGGVNFLFGDGSVKFIKDSINRTGVYFALGTAKGNEAISADQF